MYMYTCQISFSLESQYTLCQGTHITEVVPLKKKLPTLFVLFTISFISSLESSSTSFFFFFLLIYSLLKKPCSL